jgi:outer membrane protein OmpA-like peptidoglycan-associated protein
MARHCRKRSIARPDEFPHTLAHRAPPTRKTHEKSIARLVVGGRGHRDVGRLQHDAATERAVGGGAYVARQRAAITQETINQKAAELAVTDATANRDRMRLTARTKEADQARQQADSAQLASEQSRRRAEAAQQQAGASRMQAEDAQARNQQLEAQLTELNAKKTDRGLVITIADVLFDTNEAVLKASGARSVAKLAEFLQQYPQRNALVEGYTDSTGSESSNQALSSRRADAVRMALLGSGISGSRVATQGYGEAYPVAGNDSSGGRQMNRRVEVILSDDTGKISPR